MAESQRPLRRYSESFRRWIVREIEEGRLSVAQAKRRYDIGGAQTIGKWQERYGRNHQRREVMHIQRPEEVDRFKELEQQKHALESALAQAQLKIVCLQGLVEAAEEVYGEEFKKNFSSRLSGWRAGG